VLPADTSMPRAFETVGHVAHLNLREEHEAFKTCIAQVILDKHANLRSVVNKTSEVADQFRVAPLELLAGEPSLQTQVRENGVVLSLDLRHVFWNSKLYTELCRLLAMLAAKHVVWDLFAGVGPLAVPAAKAGCQVVANDLNPHSYHYLLQNAESAQRSAARSDARITRTSPADRRVHASAGATDADRAVSRSPLHLECFNADAQKLLHRLHSAAEADRRKPCDHIVLNLPDSALEFIGENFAPRRSNKARARALVRGCTRSGPLELLLQTAMI